VLPNSRANCAGTGSTARGAGGLDLIFGTVGQQRQWCCSLAAECALRHRIHQLQLFRIVRVEEQMQRTERLTGQLPVAFLVQVPP
jgi:hypothetical protein